MAAGKRKSRSKHAGGRPSKRCTKTDRAVLVGFRRLGTFRGAAGYAGIPFETLFSWLKQDPQFSIAAGIARGQYVKRHALALERKQSAAVHETCLKRVAPEEYVVADKREMLLRGDADKPVRIVLFNDVHLPTSEKQGGDA